MTNDPSPRDGGQTSPVPDTEQGEVPDPGGRSGGAAQAHPWGDQGLPLSEPLAPDERAPAKVTAPRVRADGPGGFHIATAEGKGTPWWRLIGANGEVLGHSEVYASIANAARGADTAERTVFSHAHRTGPVLYDVLLEVDAIDAVIEDEFGHKGDWRGIPEDVLKAVAGLNTREQLVTVAAVAILYADALELLGGTTLAEFVRGES